jgi:hypothetical protein
MFNRAFLGNGYGAVSMRERTCGEWWWTLNLTLGGVGGVLMSLCGIWGGVMEVY